MSFLIHPDTEIGTVHLKVSNLERSVKFYREVVGFKVLLQVGGTAELTVDGKNRLLILEEIPNAVISPRRTTTGLYHFAILVPTRKDLSLSLRNLLHNEIRVGQGDHLVSEALYINDPDNNGIEIYADRPRNTWKSDGQGGILMASDPIEWQSLLNEAADQIWDGLSLGTKIGHVHLHVADLQKSAQFYCQLLGFDIKAHLEDSALFISAGGYHHHIGLNTWAGVGAPPPPPNAVGLQYYTIVIPNKTELETILTRLRISGSLVEQHNEGWLVQDPSKNGILLVEQHEDKLSDH
jgi:catechol 2,3-dioxygenase